MPDAAFPTRSTPFPSRLLDDVMPLLSDTEWRVLCVVVRATLGWKDGQGGRKQIDWLTQSQLKARTGRASEALSRAIDGLVQKELILVCDEAGEPLATPQERRRCVGRMLFRMSPQALDAPHEASGGFGAPSLARAAELRTGDPEWSSSVSEQGYSQNEHSTSESEQGYSVSEVRKANTTKETKDKITPGGVTSQKRAQGDKPVDNSQVNEAVTAMDTASQRTVSDVQRFFASEDAWVRKRGYALVCFPTLIPTLLMQGEQKEGMQSHAREAQGQGRARAEETRCRAQATPVVVHGPSARHWQQAGDIDIAKGSLFERHPELARRVRGQPP